MTFENQSKELGVDDSIKISNINNILIRNYQIKYNTLPDTAELKLIRNSLECRFICYSPDYKYFIAVLLYRKEPSKLNHPYNDLILFCEKMNDKISIFRCSYDPYGHLTKDAAFNKAISKDFFLLDARFSLGGYGIDLKKYKTPPHPFKKEFWESEYFFDTIEGFEIKKFRYQLVDEGIIIE